MLAMLWGWDPLSVSPAARCSTGPSGCCLLQHSPHQAEVRPVSPCLTQNCCWSWVTMPTTTISHLLG